MKECRRYPVAPSHMNITATWEGSASVFRGARGREPQAHPTVGIGLGAQVRALRYLSAIDAATSCSAATRSARQSEP